MHTVNCIFRNYIDSLDEGANDGFNPHVEM